MESIEEVKLSPKSIVITVTIVVSIIIAYAWYFQIDPRLILKFNPYTLLLVISLYTLSWLLSAYRLLLLHTTICDEKLSLIDYFYARLIGGLVAYLTPSAMGGEPARAYYLTVKSRCSLSSTFAIAIMELYIDIIFINVFSLVYSLKYLPLSIPVILIAVFVLFIWTYILAGMMSENSIVNRFFEKILKHLPSWISRHYYPFINSLKMLKSRSLNLRILALIIATTIASHLLTILVVYYISLQYTTLSFIEAFTGYVFSLTLGALPSPGGAATVEYGLTITLDPHAVIAIRVFMYTYTVLLGLIAFIKMKKKLDKKSVRTK